MTKPDLTGRIASLVCQSWTRDLHVTEESVLGQIYTKVILPNHSVDGTRYEFYIREQGNSIVVRDFGITLMNLEANNVNIESDTLKRKLLDTCDQYAKDSSFETRELLSIRSSQKASETILDFINLVTIVGSFALDADFKAKFTFEDEVDMLLRSTYGTDHIIRDWTDSTLDPHGAYRTDYLILRDDQKPAATFAVSRSNSAKVAKAALAFTHYGDSFLKVMMCRDFSKLSLTDRARARDHADVIIETISGSEIMADRIELLAKLPK